jgi:hypothetical protein
MNRVVVKEADGEGREHQDDAYRPRQPRCLFGREEATHGAKDGVDWESGEER